MPMAPPRACATCGHAGCRVHLKGAWARTHPPLTKRIRGRRLTSLREESWLAAGGRCQTCERVIDLKHAIRDHIVPIEEGGLDVQENCQILCEACHQVKTQQEAQRGSSRVR